jgi:hypothetical protein
MLEYKEMKPPTSLQETFLFKGMLDLNLSWGFLGRTKKTDKTLD